MLKSNIQSDDQLFIDLRHLIEDAKSRVESVANAGITMLYWHIGERIKREILGNLRAEYGKQIVATLARQLKQEYGKGYEEKSLRRMMQFASLFPDPKIVAPLATQLSWSHFVEVIPLKDEIQREFYLTMAAEERWTKRVLRAKIDGMLFERTAISDKLFRFVGIAENAGYGMNKLASRETLTGTRPTIESDRTIATVSFPLKSAIQRKTEDSDVPVNVPVNLTETQKQVLNLIKENQHITHREIAELLSITDKTAKRTTMALRQLGMIIREGSDKTGYWKVVG